MKKGFLRSACMLALLVVIVGIIPEGIRRVSGDPEEASLLMWLLPLFAFLGFTLVISLPRLVKWLASGGWRRKALSNPSTPPDEKIADGPQEATTASEAWISRLHRREKNCFLGACVFSGLAVLGILYGYALNWMTQRELAAMGSVSARVRMNKLAELSSELALLGSLIFFFTITFLVFFANWLSSMHRRRRALEGGPSPR